MRADRQIRQVEVALGVCDRDALDGWRRATVAPGTAASWAFTTTPRMAVVTWASAPGASSPVPRVAISTRWTTQRTGRDHGGRTNNFD